MLIAQLTDGVVTNVADYQSMFPDTSFPTSGVSQEFLADNSCLGVTVWLPHDPLTQKLVPSEPYIQDEQVYTVAVAELTDDEKLSVEATKATQVRSQRDSLLASCDWTQLADSQVSKEPWVIYRQALRDITAQAGFPSDVVFPVSPAAPAAPLI